MSPHTPMALLATSVVLAVFALYSMRALEHAKPDREEAHAPKRGLERHLPRIVAAGCLMLLAIVAALVIGYA